MGYIEVNIITTPELSEILVAELAEAGYDSFQEIETGLNAYVTEKLFSEKQLKELIEKYAGSFPVSYSFHTMEEKNWNEEWEKNFQPVIIGDSCIIRASFHSPAKNFPYDIVINPKMSFGTGHHETTSMMVEHQLETDHTGKTVMDAGSGTGILAILACKLKASVVDAYDIDEWAFENLKENVILNGCSSINASLGDIKTASLSLEKYDLILANINRNVLLEEIPEYSNRLKAGGRLILSGFYKEDMPMLEKTAGEHSLTKISVKDKNNWTSVVFVK